MRRRADLVLRDPAPREDDAIAAANVTAADVVVVGAKEEVEIGEDDRSLALAMDDVAVGRIIGGHGDCSSHGSGSSGALKQLTMMYV